MKVAHGRRRLPFLLMMVLAVGASARDLGHDDALRLRREGVILPLDQLLGEVQQRYPQASLLEVELEEEDDVFVYEIELLTQEGRVRELELDARDGRILKDEEDD